MKEVVNIRKRVICLALCLGVLVNQIMIAHCNKVIAQESDNVDFIDFQYSTSDSLFEPLGQSNIESKKIKTEQIQSKVSKQVVLDKKSVEQQELKNSNNPINNKPTDRKQTIVTSSEKNTQGKDNFSMHKTVNTQQKQYSYYNPNRPKWDEFCPFGLENVRQKDEKFHFWGTNARYKADNQNYWYERKKDFDKELAFCDSVQQVYQNECYAKIRIRQQRLNASYIDPWQQAEIRRQRVLQATSLWMWYDATKNKNINVNHSGTVNKNINIHNSRHFFY